MTRTRWQEEDPDDGEDFESFEEDSSDDDRTLPCPSCGKAMYEDSPRCPSCGEYVTPAAGPSSGLSWVIRWGAILALLAAGTWLLQIGLAPW
jgi:hypothetical protein